MARNSTVALFFDTAFPFTAGRWDIHVDMKSLAEALSRVTQISDVVIHSYGVERFDMVAAAKQCINSLCDDGDWTDEAHKIWSSISFSEGHPKGVEVDLDAKTICRGS